MIANKYSIRVLSILPVFIVFYSGNEERQPATEDDGWVGSITYSYLMYDKGEREEMGVKNEWIFYRKAQMIISVKGVNKKETNTDDENKDKNMGYAYVTDKLSKWQQGTSPYIKEVKHIQVITEQEKGVGEGEVKVWVEMDQKRKTYWLKTDGPMYQVKRTSRIWSNIIEMGGGHQPEDVSERISEGIGISVPDQNIGKDPTHLSGSYVVLDAGNIKVIVTWSLRKKCPSWNNPLTQSNINTLEPRVKTAAARFIQRVNDELCIRLKVASAYRTEKEQDSLYALGRTMPGEIVTYAKGGESYHNFRKAIDVFYATETGIDLDRVLSPEIIEIARQEGFEWGGYWRKPDVPHFEMKN